MLVRPLFSLSLVAFVLLALSGCTTVNDLPNPYVKNTVLSTQSMPKGYRYQDGTPLSSPAPSTPWVKSAVKEGSESMISNTAAWQGAVYELVAQMEPHLPQDGTPLNLLRDHPKNFWKSNFWAQDTSTTSFDHYLRQILIQKGYNITTVPDVGRKIVSKTTKINGDNSYLLTASILSPDGQIVQSSSVNAILPNE